LPLPTDIKLVIFDWAGTTIDFGCQAPSGAFVAAFAEMGVVVSLAEARAPMGLHKKDHLRAMLQVPAIAERWQITQGRVWTEADVQAMYEIVTPMQVASAKTYSAMIPDVLPCVEQLRAQGLKIAGSTGYFREAAKICADAGHTQGYTPDFNICADDVPAGRPAPWMIFRCMEALGIYPTASVVKVGDTLIDIEDGLNAGCWSIGVVDSSNVMGMTHEEWNTLSAERKHHLRAEVSTAYRNAGAHAVINTLAELPALISALNDKRASGARP
jgi:phosphonoacetaldehyde hydrolase